MDDPTAFEMQSPIGAKAVINGHPVDYYGGCGYLGLQSNEVLLAAAADAVQRYGLSIATSTVTHPIYQKLAEEAQHYFAAEEVLYYASGYLGMVTLAQGLVERYERIFIDDQAHSSIWDGARSTGKPITTFQHCDAEDLVQVCQQTLAAGERPLVLSDGVFPVSGEIAPAEAYLAAVEEFDGVLALDDAHAVGVLGDHGRGTLDHYGITSDRCFNTVTLSKALGTYGGMIASDEPTIQMLRQNSSVASGATAPPLPVAAAACAAFELLRTQPTLRDNLRANVRQAREGLRGLGWMLPDSPVPIICLAGLAGVDLAAVQTALFERGIHVTHSLHYSSVPEGGAVRIAIFATHTADQIERLITVMGQVM